jgi:hypothetical protein
MCKKTGLLTGRQRYIEEDILVERAEGEKLGFGLRYTVLEFLNSLWVLGTEQEWGCRSGPPGLVPVWESFLDPLKSLKIRAQYFPSCLKLRWN